MIPRVSDNYNWDSPIFDDSGMGTRARHVVCEFEDIIYLMGGQEDSTETLTDVWTLSLSVETSTWKKIPCVGEVPSLLLSASLCNTADSLVLIGGSERLSGLSSNSVYRFFPRNSHWVQVRFRGIVPRARNSHTSVVCAGTLYVFGGWDDGEFFDDVFALHSHCTAWSQVISNSPSKPCARMGHSCSVYRNSMFVFGGFNHPRTLDDLWEFNFPLSRWEEHVPTGAPPRDRYRHSSVVLGDRLIIFGGINSQRERFNDVHVYEIAQRCWFKLELGSSPTPSPRSFHQALSIAGDMYVIGGVVDSGNKSGDFWRLTNFSASIRTSSSIAEKKTGWSLLSASGLVPRTGHVACVSQQRIIVFGGQDEAGSYLSEMQMFDINSGQWSRLESVGPCVHPPSRSGTKAVAWDDALVVFGGSSPDKRSPYLNDMFVYWISRNEWQSLNSAGITPAARTDHALTDVNGHIVLYGGTNRKAIFGDTYVFASDSSGWNEITASPSPPGRFGHTAISWDDKMVVFGGWDGSNLLNEIWQFSVSSKAWKLVTSVAGQSCCPRYRHAACSREETMFVFGGVDRGQIRLNDLWAFNLERNEWTEIRFGNNSVMPCPRTFHQAMTDGDFLYIVGGRSEKKLGDVWRISIEELTSIAAPSGGGGSTELMAQVEKLKARVAQLETRITCKVCMEAEINCVLIPCTHRCVCLSCAAVIVNRECVCPICRETILRLVETIDA